MKKLLVLLFSILISFNSYGGWSKITDSVKGHSFYIDENTIRKHNGYLYWWDMVDYISPTDNGIFSVKYYHKGDCGEFRVKALSYIFYKQPMGNGASEVANEEQPWRYPTPGSIAETMLKNVCAYIK